MVESINDVPLQPLRTALIRGFPRLKFLRTPKYHKPKLQQPPPVTKIRAHEGYQLKQRDFLNLQTKHKHRRVNLEIDPLNISFHSTRRESKSCLPLAKPTNQKKDTITLQLLDKKRHD